MPTFLLSMILTIFFLGLILEENNYLRELEYHHFMPKFSISILSDGNNMVR